MLRNSPDTLAQDVRGTLAYTSAAPTLGAWALISFVPLVSAAGAWGAPLQVLAHMGFFATGAAGLASFALLVRWMRAAPESADWKEWRPSDLDARVKRISILTLYAIVWIAAYLIFATTTG
ncbi:MAG: hypothetical protein AAGD23_12220 [Pseudomonadota bacterium]